MSLTNLEYGSLASSSALNNNFLHLDSKIDESVLAINNSLSSILSNISTINTRLADLSEEVENAIELCESNLQTGLAGHTVQIQSQLDNLSMLPDWGNISEVSSLINYIAPSNGYLLIVLSSTDNGMLKINDLIINLDVNNNLITLPIRKNNVVTCSYDTNNAYFIPAVSV